MEGVPGQPAAAILDLSEGKDTDVKMHEWHASGDTTSDALKQVDASASVVAVGGSASRLGAAAATGVMKGRPEKAKSSRLMSLLCCFAPLHTSYDNDASLTPR